MRISADQRRSVVKRIEAGGWGCALLRRAQVMRAVAENRPYRYRAKAKSLVLFHGRRRVGQKRGHVGTLRFPRTH